MNYNAAGVDALGPDTDPQFMQLDHPSPMFCSTLVSIEKEKIYFNTINYERFKNMYTVNHLILTSTLL